MKKIINFYKDCWNEIKPAVEAKDAFGVWWRVVVLGVSAVAAAMVTLALVIYTFGWWSLLLVPPILVAVVAWAFVMDEVR